MIETWFTSDSHWNHNKIIQYCNRPFLSVEQMNEEMIDRWNSVVSKEDKVYHLGDFAFGTPAQQEEIINRLNGKIYLIMGNHDSRKPQYYRDLGFIEVYDHPIIFKEFLVLTHEPLPFCFGQAMYQLYGHVHDSPMFETWGKNSACVCVERHGYYPVNLETIQQKIIEGR